MQDQHKGRTRIRIEERAQACGGWCAHAGFLGELGVERCAVLLVAPHDQVAELLIVNLAVAIRVELHQRLLRQILAQVDVQQ